jgi:hypothetical protein
VSSVVKSPYGFHIFKLEGKRPAGMQGLEEASPAIREKLAQQKQDRRYRQWIKELRSRTKFEVNYQAWRSNSGRQRDKTRKRTMKNIFYQRQSPCVQSGGTACSDRVRCRRPRSGSDDESALDVSARGPEKKQRREDEHLILGT